MSNRDERPHSFRMMRPVLTIEYIGTTSIGKYCSSIRYRVVSPGRRLSEEQLNMLFQARLLGVGQEFRIVTRCDADMPPAGHDECSLVYGRALSGRLFSGPSVLRVRDRNDL